MSCYLNYKTRWLNREVFGFGLTSFFSDLSHEVATSVLPVFLASLGAPPYAVGLIEGLADGMANAGKLLGGWLSDRLGMRKPLALAGYILNGLAQGLYAFVTAWPQALLVRAAGWAGRGWRAPIRDALFHDAVTKETSGRAFGFERTMDTLGAVIAPLCAFFFVLKIGFRHLFLLTWIPALLAVVCFWTMVRDRKKVVIQRFSLTQGIGAFTPQYRRFLLAVTLFGLADFSHTLLIYWAGVLLTPVHGLAKASSLAILLYVLHNVVYAGASYPMGYWADKVGKYRVLTLGYMIACAMFLCLAFAKASVGFLAVVFALGGLAMAVEDALERALAGDLLRPEIKGTGYGVLASLNGMGDMLSSFIVGVLLSVGSPVLAFGYCLIVGASGATMMLRVGQVSVAN